MKKFSVMHDGTQVTVMCSNKGKSSSYSFLEGSHRNAFREAIKDDETYNLFELLVDIIGKRKAEEIFYAIVNQYVGDILIEIKNKKYKIAINDKHLPYLEYLPSIDEMIENLNVKVTVDEINEIKLATDNWLKDEVFEDSKSFDILESSSEIKAMRKGVFWPESLNDYRLEAELVNITSRRRSAEIISKLKAKIADENEIIIQVGPKLYSLQIVNDTPTLKKYSGNPYENVVPILEEYMSAEDTKFLLNFPPSWIPRGFKYSRGTVDSGYVICNSYGDEFIYIPLAEAYFSHIITKGKNAKIASKKSKTPLKVNLNEAYSLINQTNIVDADFYEKSYEGRFYAELCSEQAALALAINNAISLGFKTSELNYYDFLSEEACLSSTKIPSGDELDEAYGYITYDNSYEQIIFKNNKAVFSREFYDIREELAFRISLHRYFSYTSTSFETELEKDFKLRKEAEKIKKDFEHQKKLDELVYGIRLRDNPDIDDY